MKFHKKQKIKVNYSYCKIRFYIIIMKNEYNLYQKKKEISTAKKLICIVQKKYRNLFKKKHRMLEIAKYNKNHSNL